MSTSQSLGELDLTAILSDGHTLTLTDRSHRSTRAAQRSPSACVTGCTEGVAIQASGRNVRCARLQLQPGEQGREVAVPISAAVLLVAAAAHLGSTSLLAASVVCG